MLWQLCDDASTTVLIENNGVASKWVSILIWSDSIGSSVSSIAGVIVELLLTLDVNGTLVGRRRRGVPGFWSIFMQFLGIIGYWHYPLPPVWEILDPPLPNVYDSDLNEMSERIIDPVFKYKPGYFPPLFLLMRQTMIRTRSRNIIAHIIPMNQPADATLCVCGSVMKERQRLNSAHNLRYFSNRPYTYLSHTKFTFCLLVLWEDFLWKWEF